MSGERSLRSKTRRAVRRSLAELSERTLRRRLPVLRCLPLRALPYRSIARARNPITKKLSPSTVQAFWTAARAREGFCRFPAFFVHGRPHRGSGRTGLKPGRPVPRPAEHLAALCSPRMQDP
jgi:hypothetical protein